MSELFDELSEAFGEYIDYDMLAYEESMRDALEEILLEALV